MSANKHFNKQIQFCGSDAIQLELIKPLVRQDFEHLLKYTMLDSSGAPVGRLLPIDVSFSCRQV